MRRLFLALSLILAASYAYAQWVPENDTLQRQVNPLHAGGYDYRLNMGTPGVVNFYTQQQVDSLLKPFVMSVKDTIALKNYSGVATSLNVMDSSKAGGIYNYSLTKPIIGVITKPAVGKGSGYWVKNIDQSRIIAYPDSMTFRPFVIYKETGKYRASQSARSVRDALESKYTKYYIDYQNGNDTNPGLDPALPKKTANSAYAAGARLIYAAPGIYRQNAFTITQATTDTSNFLIIGAGKDKTFFTGGDYVSRTWTAMGSGAYNTNSTSTGATLNVLDAKFMNQYGLITQLRYVSTSDSVTNVAGTWYTDGTLTYVHTQDGRLPDNNVIVSKPSANTFSANNGTAYFEGITFAASSRAITVQGNTSTSASNLSSYFYDCDFLYGSNSGEGLAVLNTKLSWVENFTAALNKRDGLNYKSGNNTVPMDFVEINGASFKNGVWENVPDPTYTSNGSSAHNSIDGIRINSIYYGNYGPNVIDVSSLPTDPAPGKVQHIMNLGCTAYDSKGKITTDINGGTSDFNEGSSGYKGYMYLYGCISKSDSSFKAKPASTIYVDQDCQYIGTLTGNIAFGTPSSTNAANILRLAPTITATSNSKALVYSGNTAGTLAAFQGTNSLAPATLYNGLLLDASNNLRTASTNGGTSTAAMWTLQNPQGGNYRPGVSSSTGAIKIILPSSAAAQLLIKGSIFDFVTGASETFILSCYTASMASNPTAVFLGQKSYNVRYYTNGTTPTIYIGELTSTWGWLSVSIDEVQINYSGTGLSTFSTGWVLGLEPTAFTGTLAATIANTLPNANVNGGTITSASPTFTGTVTVPTPAFSTTATVAVDQAYIPTAANALLSATATINTKATGTTALYTVPAGKTLMVTGVYVRCTAASAITAGPAVDVGDTGNGAASIYANTTMSGLNALGKIYQYTTGGVYQSVAAGSTVNFNINTAASGTSQTVTVYLTGFLQ